MRAPSYLAWLGGTVASLAAGVIALAITVDPYYIFGTPTLAGWNQLKPRAYQQVDMAKEYQLDRIGPRILILGNSRSEIGLDPQSPIWPSTKRPVFNGAIAGGSVFQSLVMLREALAVGPLEMVILGVDFLDTFTEGKAPGTPSPDERRLIVDRNGHPNPAREFRLWEDRLSATLTIGAVADSVMTLLEQSQETTPTMTPLGFNPMHEYRVMVARSGYSGLFAQKKAMYRKQYASYAKPQLADLSSNAAYRHLGSIMQLASRHGVPLVLYVHPYHVEFLEMLRELGLWSSFEAWKRAMTVAVSERDQAAPGAVRLIDFSGYNAFTTEPVPPPGDRQTEMRWYWEPGHYKSALGEHILATIFGVEAAPAEWRFGRDVTPANIDAVLSGIREERARFLAARKSRLDASLDQER